MGRKGKRYKTKKEVNMSKKQNARKKNNVKKKKSKKFLSKILFLVFLIGMIYSGTQIFIWIKENNQNNKIVDNLKCAVKIVKNDEGNEEHNVDFIYLKSINPDTIGWIKVNGTDIDYPVVKTTNNDFYLTHSFDKSYNSAGWVFLNYNNVLNQDENTVIFAHNRRDGSMFGTLKNILTEDWQNNSNNLVVPFITENENAMYQVFSVYTIENEDFYITTSFKNDESFGNFLNVIKDRSVKNFGVDVSSNDKILTLSTCADDNKYRVVLHAKKVDTKAAIMPSAL